METLLILAKGIAIAAVGLTIILFIVITVEIIKRKNHANKND